MSFSVLSLVVLSSCGTSDCDANSGAISLDIAAPPQYPARVEITVPIVMTNTSSNDANNLVYTIPAPGTNGNTTGVPIEVFPNGLGNNC